MTMDVTEGENGAPRAGVSGRWQRLLNNRHAVILTATAIGALGVMAAGAGMQFGLLTRSKTLSTAVLAIRHLAQPLIAFAMAQLFALNPVQTTVLLAFSALPTASTCYVLAARMGYNGPYVAGLVTLSTLLGVVSLPFALGFLR